MTIQRPTIYLSNLIPALLLIVGMLGLSSAAVAGGHKSTAPVVADPAKRSDVTGTVLVTGANRGIGLAIAQNYAERGWTVIATARKPEKADELNALAKSNPRVTVERMDLLDHEGIDALAEKLRDVPIDILLNNAAMLGDPAAQDFGSYDFDVLARVIAVNVAGTMKMAEAFVDHVAASDQKKIIAITSQQGSITELRDLSIPFYKMSKTALNMGMNTIAKHLKKQKITVGLISPGAVDTDMMNSALDHANFKGKKGWLLTTEQSAEAVINVADQITLKMSGDFMAHTGTVIPW